MSEKKFNRKQLQELISISASMLRLKSFEAVCQVSAESIVKHSIFERCVVSSLQPDDTFKRIGFGGLADDEINVLQGMSTSTLDSMKNRLVEDYKIGRSYYIPQDAIHKMEGLKSEKVHIDSKAEWHPDDFLFIPLYDPDNSIIGLISVDDPKDGMRPTEDSLLALELFATQIAAALENLNNREKQEEMIQRLRDQQKVVLELSTPVIKIWDKVLVLPLIGSVDSARAQQIMENVLVKIGDTNSQIIIIDITGVPIIDTLVASHLIKTVSAARLLGAKTIITGINPEIAQTLVHLGVNLEEITTKNNLARGISTALEELGKTVVDVDTVQ
jgi:anti-anti-sigma regulatory factor